MKLIDERNWKTAHSWWRISHWRYSVMYRVSIEHNAYEDQSHAKIERWDGSKWRYVYHIPPALMASWKHNHKVGQGPESVYYGSPEAKILPFLKRDERELCDAIIMLGL